MGASNVLDVIMDRHRALIASDTRSLSDLKAEALGSPTPRSFQHAIDGSDGMAIIAEFKRSSPSTGSYGVHDAPEVVARSYVEGGAAAMSILTDEEFFGGSLRDIAVVREAFADLPILRKDFTVDVRDVYDARIAGADAVLLILAALSDKDASVLLAAASECGLGALVETHNEEEIERAGDLGATIIGINQRNLTSLEVTPTHALDLRACVPTNCVAVAESGVSLPAEATALREAGFHAALIGTTLLRAPDRCAATRAFVNAGRVAYRKEH